MRYRFARTLFQLLSCAVACLFLGCGNCEWTDMTGEEEAVAESESPITISKESEEPKVDSIRDENNVKDDNSNAEKNYTTECFDNCRLPKLESKPCKKTFFAPDTVVDFPQSGFFQKAFVITFPNGNPLNCEIGGNVPTTESPLVSAILIDSSTTIRCIDFSAKQANTEIIRNYILEDAPAVAAVFLTADPNSLFDPDTGVYMLGQNAEEELPHFGANYWADKEIPVHVEFIENGQTSPAFAKNAGLKIFGKFSRINSKKSVSITFREKYGDKRLNYPLFPETPELTKFKGFVLRNNGNNFEKDYIRDRLASSLSEGLNVDYQRGRFVIVYYNGEYYGIHDLRERANEYYFETHYGISKDNVNLLKVSSYVSAGSGADYNALIQWIMQNSLDVDSNYAYVDSQIDIDNYLNYVHVEVFANNLDWPGNNLKRWNQIAPKTKWKWLLYDLDMGFGSVTYTEINFIDYMTSNVTMAFNKNSPIDTFLFRSLLKNEGFKAAFINRLMVLLQTNFERSKILAQIDKMMSEIESEIPRDQERWQHDVASMNNELNIIKEFAQARAGIITDNLREYFELGKVAPVKLATKGPGTLLVHGLPLSEPETTVDFFEGFPVTLTAMPENGHKWGGWSDGDTSTTRIILPEAWHTFCANFY